MFAAPVRSWFVLIAITVGAGFASQARADGKVISPSSCRLAGGGTTGLSYGAGHVTNTSGASAAIVCPVFRDTVSNSNGLLDLEVAVGDSTGTISCDALALDRAGNITKSVTRRTPGTGAQVIDFAATLNASSNRGHYSVICQVPNGSRIHSLFYDEPAESGADGKVMAPSACRPAGNVTTGLSYGAGHVTNTSGATMDIVCPIARDNVSNGNGLSDLEVAVNDATGTMSCDGLALDRAGNILKSASRTTPGTGPQVLDFGSTLNLSADRGHYSVICHVPNGSRIHSVFFGEP
jgi:hypothetical protein